MRLFQVGVSFLFLLAVQGCAALTEPFGIEDPFAIEHPFEGVARNEAMLNPSFDLATLVVQTPKGLDDEFATVLRDRVIGVLQSRDVPALSATSMRAWVLKGRVATLMSNGERDNGHRVVVWRLFDPDRVLKGQFSIFFQGENAGTVEPRLSEIAEQIADKTDRLFRPQQSVSTTIAPAIDKPVVWIGTIKGAPGDGNVALVRALQSALPLNGMRVEGVQGKAEWRVECTVRLKAQSATQDVVEIHWRLLDAAGKEVGTLAQENPIPHGRLNKPWREIATFAAEAAAEGFRQVIQQVTRGQKS